MPKRMRNDDLLAEIERQEAACMGEEYGDLASERSEALDYFLGKKVGDLAPRKDRSSIVMTVVRDSVLWIMPSLLRIFASDTVAEFEPTSAQDEDQAEQETRYVNYVFQKQNPGFLNLYSWFFDALVSKNGILKAWWDESETVTTEEYEGLTVAQLAMLVNEEGVVVVEQDTYIDDQGFSLYNVKIENTEVDGRVRVEAVPPEEFGISKDCSRLDCQDAQYVRQKRDMSPQELRDLGVPQKTIDKLPRGRPDDTQEERSRNFYSDEENDYDTDEIEVLESYLRIDFDGDGRDELRRIMSSGGEILFNEETDHVPFYAITPIILTHKFFGLSIADLLIDLQKIYTMLYRNVLDSLYQAVNPETKVVEGLVRMEDQVESRMGGIKRIRGSDPANIAAMEKITTPFAGAAAFPMFEHIEKLQSQRTGVGELTQGLSADQISNTNTGVMNQASDMARMKIEMLARIFAETGMKSLMLGIHRLVLQHQSKPKSFRLGKEQWVEVDPRTWAKRDTMTITVGLGTGNKDQMLGHLLQVWEAQKEMVAGGGLNVLVTPGNIYNTWKEIIENSGLRDATRFFTQPDREDQPQQEQGGGEEDAMQMAAQAEMMKAQADHAKVQSDTAIAMQEQQRKMLETQAKIKAQQDELETKLTELELKYSVDVPGSKV